MRFKSLFWCSRRLLFAVGTGFVAVLPTELQLEIVLVIPEEEAFIGKGKSLYEWLSS
jgi:hypothetical protein